MDPGEHAYDNAPDSGGMDDMGQMDHMGAGTGSERQPGDNDFGDEADHGYEDSGQQAWESPEKQDDNSFSNLPTSPPTARTQGRESPQALTMGSSTGGDWNQQPGWPKRNGKPEHQGEWEANTLGHLNHAKSLIQKAAAHHQDNERSIMSSHGKRGGRGNQTGAVYTLIKKKMSLTNDLIKALEDRHESVEDTIRQMGECLFQLQRAHRSKWASLNICERRLELRDTRPLQELVRDHTQEALEHERQTLVESRQELSDQIQASKEALISLDKLKTEVVEDLSSKRHGLRIDRSCLSPQKASTSHVQDRVVLPQLGEVTNYTLPGSPGKDGGGGGPQQDDGRQVDTKGLIHKAVRMEEDAMRLCNESDAIMLQTKRECQRASTQAQTSLARRADETDNLKRQLETQMREIDDAVCQTEMSLGRTKKKLENMETPLKTLDMQFEMRNRQTAGSSGRDPVLEEMETHLESMKKSVRALTTKFQNTKTLLEHLKESRQQLTEDYRCKLLALKIEDACLKVTARKAMELDRTDPRGGRCKVASARNKTPRKEGAYSLMPSMPQHQDMQGQVAMPGGAF